MKVLHDRILGEDKLKDPMRKYQKITLEKYTIVNLKTTEKSMKPMRLLSIGSDRLIVSTYKYFLSNYKYVNLFLIFRPLMMSKYMTVVSISGSSLTNSILTG